MRIHLNQTEIEAAIHASLSTQITVENLSDITIDFTAGRGDNGLTATLEVPYLGVTSLPEAAATGPIKRVTPAPVIIPDIRPASLLVVEESAQESEAETSAPSPGQSLFTSN